MESKDYICNHCTYYCGILCAEGDGICRAHNDVTTWDDTCGIFTLSPEARRKEVQQREYELV